MSEEFKEKRRQAVVGYTALISLSVLIILGISFLVISSYANLAIVARRAAYVVGSADLVFPGPGDTTANAYWEGEIVFQLVDHTINWRFAYGNLGAILAMDIFGPTLPSNPLDGPVFLTLCGPPTSIACLSSAANLLEQIIREVSPTGQPLNEYIKTITDRRTEFKIRIRTQNFPDGAMVARLNIAF